MATWRVRPAFLEHEAAQPLAVVVEQRRRAHRAGDQDGVLRQALARRRVVAAGQLAHQAVGEVVEIVQALAQIGVGLPQHAGAGVGLHALDRGLGGQAGHHRLVAACAPSRGRRRTCDRLRARRDARRRRRRRRVRAARRDRRAASRSPLRAASAPSATSSAMKLVTTTRGSCSTTWPSAMPSESAMPLRCSGRRAAGSAPGRRQRRQLARGDHLGQHHGGRLQRLDFLLGIGAPGAVLHHQHAERVAGAQHRHAEEGVVDLFAGLRPVGEGRMRLRVRTG